MPFNVVTTLQIQNKCELWFLFAGDRQLLCSVVYGQNFGSNVRISDKSRILLELRSKCLQNWCIQRICWLEYRTERKHSLWFFAIGHTKHLLEAKKKKGLGGLRPSRFFLPLINFGQRDLSSPSAENDKNPARVFASFSGTAEGPKIWGGNTTVKVGYSRKNIGIISIAKKMCCVLS